MSRSDELEVFLEMCAVRWKRDPKFRARLMLEATPTVAETLKRRRAS